jgi:hypothetical protein
MTRALAIAALVILAPELGAQNPSGGQVAVMGCQNAARQEIKAQRGTDSIRFAQNAAAVERSKREMGVHGSGQYFDRSSGAWRPFSYECTFRSRSAKTVVTLQFDSTAAPRP